MGELLVLSGIVVKALKIALEIFETGDGSRKPLVDELENEVDCLSEKCLKSHIERLKNGECDPWCLRA